MDVRLTFANDPATASDGYGVRIDRPWPRGLSREHGQSNAWEHNDAVVGVAEVLLGRGLPTIHR